jgi:hypothetical protein
VNYLRDTPSLVLQIYRAYISRETRPTAVPVRAKGICPFSITANKGTCSIHPAATIKIDIKNKTVVELVIIPVASIGTLRKK